MLIKLLEFAKRLTGSPTIEVPAPAPSMPVQKWQEPSQQALRNLLCAKVQGQAIAPELYYSQPGLVRRWAHLLTKEMAIRVMSADDKTIRRHITDRERMRKMIPCTAEDVAAHERARELAARPQIDELDRSGGGGKRLKASAMQMNGGPGMGRR